MKYSKDIEYIMTVIRQSERMNDCIETNDSNYDGHCRQRNHPMKLSPYLSCGLEKIRKK